MAGSARSSAAAKHAYRMFAPSSRGGHRCPGSPGAAADDFDESDVVWGTFGASAAGGGVDYSAVPPGAADLQQAVARARPIPAAAAGRKKPADGAAAGSLPMNIPDWQKILGVEYRDHHHAGEWEIDGDDGDDYGGRTAGAGTMVPPHELAWRSRAASMSVHEGIGRTLKGRDLSRVRDAVWKKTGFED